ncbi:uncharacterized protein NECHADRAFT_88272 [Fusarium vanettenii 77-13-4]|uniref:Extracellular membrane protein CFEM domain-containing protein n=1 Tax=Fusarium vanettenii (strain ATCC MYA-4622 / CBS 123669 / FGSC 9596 / NRRL 45880 / 77-13-4) TaxID=660122 RepID=C7ZE04_FUSV7|nr:uncharacterized protein NECHADRAFT_88272 [Fusarium vanettenii 77-13-4]EEU37820.1 hypothetical protein NECHADRAFT_88272 [Fusarium vanettenii 77-13-4]
MAPFFSWLMLFSLLGVGHASAQRFNQEEQNRNADCDNGCFFGSFPGGSCTNDAACMCTQQEYRERYFCCMAEKCAASVLPDSIQRQTLECEARNMEFTFDVEKVCGIKLTTTSSAVSFTAPFRVSSTVISGSDESSTTSTLASTASTPETTTDASSAGTSEASSAGNSAPTTNSGLQLKAMVNGIAITAALSGIMLW